MAKSLRSKWRRKMRNIKRERYGKKELIRLKKMLGLPTDEDTPAPNADNVIEFGGDVEMKTDVETSKTENGVSAKDVRRIQRMVREGSDCEDSENEKEVQQIIVMTTSRKLRDSYRPKQEKGQPRTGARTKDTFGQTNAEAMEHDQTRVFNSKTLKDQHGNYPTWLNQKKMRTLAKTNRKLKKKTKKRLAQAGARRPLLRHQRIDHSAEQSEDSELDIDEEVEAGEEDGEATAIQEDVNTTVNASVEEADMQPETVIID